MNDGRSATPGLLSVQHAKMLKTEVKDARPGEFWDQSAWLGGRGGSHTEMGDLLRDSGPLPPSSHPGHQRGPWKTQPQSFAPAGLVGADL